MIRPSYIEAAVIIRRPVSEVFRFYSDFTNLPRFLGDVISVEKRGPSTSKWTIQGPLRTKLHWTVEVTEVLPDRRIRYRTISLPALQALWNVTFTTGAISTETEVRELMEVPLGRFGQAALGLVGKSPAAEVAANLQRLKELMETGKLLTTRHWVKSDFPG